MNYCVSSCLILLGFRLCFFMLYLSFQYVLVLPFRNHNSWWRRQKWCSDKAHELHFGTCLDTMHATVHVKVSGWCWLAWYIMPIAELYIYLQNIHYKYPLWKSEENQKDNISSEFVDSDVPYHSKTVLLMVSRSRFSSDLNSIQYRDEMIVG